MQQILHEVGEETAAGLVSRLLDTNAALESDNRAMRELLAKIGAAERNFQSRRDNTMLILMDYGAQCGLWQEWTVGLIRAAAKWGRG